MLTIRSMPTFLRALCVAGVILPGIAARSQAQSSAELRIDVPTQLEKGNVVIDFGHLVMHGDMPFALGDTHLLAEDFRQWGTKGKIVVIFHGDAAFLVLNDSTYNKNRSTTTGNPYKGVLEELAKEGVQLELCGATAQGNHWGNGDLLPEIKVNVNAMVRVTQLEQEGYSMIYQ